MSTHGDFLRRPLPAALAVLGLLAPALPAAAGIELVGVKQVKLRWASASGPVAGYGIFVARNGSAFTDAPERVVKAPKQEAVIGGRFGDRLRVRVAAFDDDGRYGPPSPPSDEIVLHPPGHTFGDGSGGGGGDGKKGGGGKKAGGGKGGGSGRPAPDPCGASDALDGKGLVKLRRAGREVFRVAGAVEFCDDRWIATTDDGVTLAGSYRSTRRGRRLVLELDAGARAALLGVAGADTTKVHRHSRDASLRRAPKLRIKINRARTRMKLKVKLPLESEVRDEVVPGLYRLRLTGRLEPRDS